MCPTILTGHVYYANPNATNNSNPTTRNLTLLIQQMEKTKHNSCCFLVGRFDCRQSLELLSSRAAPALVVSAFERLPQFDRQGVQDGVLLLGRAAEAAAAGRRAPGIRVGGFKELSHETEAGLANVGAAGEHVEDGVDSAAEEGKGDDVGTSC